MRKSKDCTKFKVGDEVLWINAPSGDSSKLIYGVGVITECVPVMGYIVIFGGDDYRSYFDDNELKKATKLQKALM